MKRREFIKEASMTAAVAVLPVDATLGLSRKNLGQYFTPEKIASFMLSLSKIGSDAKVLEPSSGEGVFIELLQQKGVSDIVGYEIDPVLAKSHSCVKCESFVGADIKERFDLVISSVEGNVGCLLQLKNKMHLNN